MKAAVQTWTEKSITAGLILLLALFVRLGYLWEISGSPFAEFPVNDGEFYLSWAKQIAAGNWEAKGLFFMAPLYPLILGAWLKVTAGGLLSIFFLQIGLSVLLCFLTWRLGIVLFGRRMALLALLFMAVNPVQVFYSTELVKNTMVDVCNLSMVLLFVLAGEKKGRARLQLLGLSGLFFGLGIHFRPNLLLFWPVAIFWMLLWIEAAKTDNLSDWLLGLARRFKLIAAGLLLFSAAGLTVVAPLTIYNYQQSGKLVLVIPSGGMNFYTGNHAQATGTYTSASWMRSQEPFFEQEAFRLEASRRLGVETDLVESSRYWTAQTWKWIALHPLQFGNLALKKVLLFFNTIELPLNQSFYLAKEFSSLLNWLPFGFGLMAPLAMAGFYLYRKSWKSLFPLYALPGMYLAANLMMFTASEYRAPAVPFMTLAAAAALMAGVRLLRSKDSQAVGIMLGLWMASALFINWPLQKPALMDAWSNLGTAVYRQGYVDEAQQLMRRANGIKETDPRFRPKKGPF